LLQREGANQRWARGRGVGGEEAEGRDEEVAWEKVREGKEQFEFTP